ncbi:RNA methyltransferase [Zavarzinella formosa]|uniref:RNA methyltransferase n=1 Tax=Zavarzinella formosa TaxID=360055 RepID=UPI0002FDE85E|nr:RNA methyltransferase [Zavarzinella formosa]
MIANTRVVLVRPHYAGNVGSVARVMKNFGLNQLTLVSPYADPLSDEARRMSTHGENLLTNAKIVDTFEEAVADCQLVFATSANVEGLYRGSHYGRPDEVLPVFVDSLQTGPSALVFGPEPHGLANAEIAQCHGLIRIITDHEYSSLNLSMAVGICLYELRRQFAQRTANYQTPPSRQIANYASQEEMFRHLRHGLEAIHYVWGTKADLLFHGIRQLIARSNPTPVEVRMLHGLARQMEWVAAQLPPKADDQPSGGE